MDAKRALPIELFFDLVFVCAITQIVSLVAHHLTARGLFHGALVLAMLWWGWTVFTWAANSIDLEPRWVRVVFLLSMAVIFVMAQAVPDAFEGGGPWLAGGYLIIRLLGFWIYWHGTAADLVQRAALRLLIPASMVGPVVILVGAYMGDAQQWWWLAGWIIELLSAGVAGRADWHVQAEHFAERHGLIMIIAFGEAIVAVGAVVADATPSAQLAQLLVVGILEAMALWWAYFDRMEGLWEQALARAEGLELGRLARDVYSILHYPMIAGVVLYAVSLEEIILHPDDPVEGMVRVTLGLSRLVFLLPIVAASWRAVRSLQWERAFGAVVIAGLVFLSDGMQAKTVLLGTTLLLIVALTIEFLRSRALAPETAPPS